MSKTRQTDRMDIYIEEPKNTILVQQKWKYDWLNAPGTTAWTYLQKEGFHHKIDTLVWSKWAGHFNLRTKGKSPFAKKYASRSLTINFDIKWTIGAGEHWQVNVKKIAPGMLETSSVKWKKRVIKLDTEDLILRKRVRNKKSYYQYPAVHEFGHAIGNSTHTGHVKHGDEYKAGSSFRVDKVSIMNVGSELRKRHLDYVVHELNQMIPDTTFYVYSIK